MANRPPDLSIPIVQIEIGETKREIIHRYLE
jgi:hypothetical protein